MSCNLLFIRYPKRLFVSLRPFLLLMFLFLNHFHTNAQITKPVKNYINKLIRDTTDIREPQLIAYPTLAYAPETSWEFGFSTLFVYYANRDTTNRLSEVNGFTFYTLEKQYGAWFEHALYTQGNRWSFIGRLRYQNFPLLYFGIGPHTASQFQARVDARLLNIRERALKKITNNIFIGAEVDLQRLSSVNFIPHSQTNFDKPLGYEGSTNIGFGSGILYDNRHNVLNVRHGEFSELAMLHYDKRWGSTYSFTSIISDNRIYRPVNKRDVLAAQVFGQFSIGQPPFNQLSLLGGESLMRGYYTGRFRDRNQISTQLEYRLLPLPFKFSKRFGASVFGSTGTVFNRFEDFKVKDFVFAGGAGLRFLLFPKKDVFTRLDIAFTKEGRGIYIFIGEAF